MAEPAWRLWPDIVLRGAGLPVRELLRLADPETAALALDPDSTAEQIELSWQAGAERASADLLEIARGDSFTAALLWQNPEMIGQLIGWLLRHEHPYLHNRDRRRKEATLARYAQRYHVRNETIGSFGPYVWFRFDSGGTFVRAGARLVSRRSVRFEDWAIDALAGALSADAATRSGIPAARRHGVVVRGRQALRPGAPPHRLPAADAAVLARLDGIKLAVDLADDLRRRNLTEIRGEHDVLAVLERLNDAGLIIWKYDVPQDAWPERALQNVPAAAEALGRLEEGRRRLELAGDRPESLAAAFQALDADLVELTGGPAVHSRDQRPMGRRAVYEECERDLELRLGADVKAALLPPMHLMLAGAQWLTWRFGSCLEALLSEIFDRTAAGAPVPLGLLVGQFFERMGDHSWFAAATEEFQDIWHDLLAFQPGTRRVTRQSSDLADLVRTRFAAPPPTWYGACHHSPDVMIAARGPEDLCAGRYEFVLGELHPAMVTVDSVSFAEFHPDPPRLMRYAERALARHPRLVPVYPRTGELTGRDYPTPELYSDRYWYLSFSPGNGERPTPRGRLLELSKLIAERDPDLVVRTPDGGRLTMLDVFGELAQDALGGLFRPLRPLPHTPRVTIDRLVMARETWRVPAAEIPHRGSGGAAYAALRHWADAHGMPRFVFWRAAPRTKPRYLDFDSPLFVNDFLTEVRKGRKSGGVISITEMHPDPAHTWLPDAQGRTHTSELRLVFSQS
ncbi:lantibiotic dehydratase [Nonomuraea aurantiaca]|uniref:lantibiotic dehydratase n=1 Tax=Nonomuraea aurantiaca TaxID=2878562 RepID=UPI001CDA4867|nr:lantibiotic dehydratase [Nonomuraea aurantiaca]MCA2227870.1 lantibiotic dehydratase family protein [Nonomuraea aurantiaca]